MNKKCALYIISFCVVLFLIDPATARFISFQPRIEMGVIQYEFESEGWSRAFYPAKNQTASAFEYSDVMPFVSAGLTFFTDRFFLDISGQYAYDGDDSGNMTRSMFSVSEFDTETNFFNSDYIAYSPANFVKFDRTDVAVSLGYALSDTTSIFVGYKMAETQFNERYDGPYSLIAYDAETDPNDIDYTGGRIWGVSTYEFEYAGPFIGFTQGWDFSDARLLKGVLSANLALAHLDGKLVAESEHSSSSITQLDDQQIPEYTWSREGSSLSSRDGTKGEALGLKASVAWRGMTPWEGLSYMVGMSCYRYEFHATDGRSNINETAISWKVGLSYLF